MIELITVKELIGLYFTDDRDPFITKILRKIPVEEMLYAINTGKDGFLSCSNLPNPSKMDSDFGFEKLFKYSFRSFSVFDENVENEFGPNLQNSEASFQEFLDNIDSLPNQSQVEREFINKIKYLVEVMLNVLTRKIPARKNFRFQDEFKKMDGKLPTKFLALRKQVLKMSMLVSSRGFYDEISGLQKCYFKENLKKFKESESELKNLILNSISKIDRGTSVKIIRRFIRLVIEGLGIWTKNYLFYASAILEDEILKGLGIYNDIQELKKKPKIKSQAY